MLADWHHFALLEFFQIPGESHELKYVSKKLKTNLASVKLAVERLEKLGHLVQTDSNKYKVLYPRNSWVDTTNTSEARMRLQKQYLVKASESIDQIQFSMRENSSLTVAVDKNLIPEIKIKIEEFKRELNSWIEKAGTPTDVYQLCIALYPLTEIKKGEL